MKSLYPLAAAKINDATNIKQNFVHYTTAATALQILSSKTFWLRNTACMNDSSEILYGEELLASALASCLPEIERALDGITPGLAVETVERYKTTSIEYNKTNFIACLSEHLPSEDRLGRLSMWRAYGGSAGVAIIMNGRYVINSHWPFNTYTSPVAYLDELRFIEQIHVFVRSLEENKAFLKSIPREILDLELRHVFYMAVACVKHPGFGEEREWRVLYNPTHMPSQSMTPSIECVNGVPQAVYKVPLCSNSVSLGDVLSHVIIGPCQFPDVVQDAFVRILTKSGVRNARGRVIKSDIPLRC